MKTMQTEENNKIHENEFESATLFFNEQFLAVKDLPWNPHPAFEGVFLKHLLKGENTGDQISCHLVKVDPECKIGLHNHAGKTELHEVLQGDGDCAIGATKINYRTGSIALIPADINHIVTAGEKGLVLLAKFFPPLV